MIPRHICTWLAVVLFIYQYRSWVESAEASPIMPPRTSSVTVRKPLANVKVSKEPLYPMADKPITHLLNGSLMNEIKHCPHTQQPLKPENIHVVTLASPYYFQKGQPYEFSLKTVEFYTKLHGYPYRVVNPIDVMKVHGHIRPDDPGGEIICAKSLVMLCKQRYIFVCIVHLRFSQI